MKVEFIVDGVNIGHGIILPAGKDLVYHVDGQRRIAKIGHWFLAPSTLEHPDFKLALWKGLSPIERTEALTRKS